MGIIQLYNDNVRKLPNEYGDVSVMIESLSDVKQAEITEEFKSTSRYLDDLLNIDNP